MAPLTESSCLRNDCSPADEKGKFDELVEDKGVRILIEPTAVMHVLGTRMNYIEDKLKWVDQWGDLLVMIFGTWG